MEKIRPMLAHTEPVDPATIVVVPGKPRWVSPKYDGVRVLIKDGVAVSRTLKPIPNAYVQSLFGRTELDGLDGELVVGSPTDPHCINNTTSGVMSRDGIPDVTLFVFDCWHTPHVPYRNRYGYVKNRVKDINEILTHIPLVVVRQTLCHTSAQIVEAVGGFYEAGYEGAIVRTFDSPYKYNRSTLREGYMLKVKESLDSEIRVTGFIEMNNNLNEAKPDERGLTKRSSHKANKVAAGTLGKLIGDDLATGKEVKVGTGKMTDPEKLEVWNNQDKYLGRIAKYRFAKHGVLDLPRHPRFIVWRSKDDL